ncbi:MAG: hypothetical protein ACE5OZ_17130 [Candidatus Heimdallarchaeota archaeon]
MTSILENDMASEKIASQGLIWDDMTIEERKTVIENHRAQGRSWRDIAVEVGKSRKNHSTILQWAHKNLKKYAKKREEKEGNRLQIRIAQLERELQELKVKHTNGATLSSESVLPVVSPVPASPQNVPPPPPPPKAQVATTIPPRSDVIESSKLDWKSLSLEEIEALPPEAIAQLSASERKKLFSLLSMTAEEREEYLRKQAEQKQTEDTNQGITDDISDNKLFKKLQSDLEEFTTTSQGRFMKWDTTYDYRFCLECQQRFRYEGAPAICPTCQTDNPDIVVQWSPALDPTCE